MLNFINFDLPTDGLTRVSELDSYDERALRTEGYTMVGIATVEMGEDSPKAFGVWRLTTDDAIRLAKQNEAKAIKEMEAQRTRAYEAEQSAKELRKQLAQLQEESSERDAYRDQLGKLREELGSEKFHALLGGAS